LDHLQNDTNSLVDFYKTIEGVNMYQLEK